MKKIILAAIFILFLSGCAYNQISAPDRFLPEKCAMPAGLACLDFTASLDSVSLTIQNSMGFGLDDVELSLVDSGDVLHACVSEGDNLMDDGEQKVFVCSGEFQQGRLNGDISISYINSDNGLNSIKVGNIIAMIK